MSSMPFFFLPQQYPAGSGEEVLSKVNKMSINGAVICPASVLDCPSRLQDCSYCRTFLLGIETGKLGLLSVPTEDIQIAV